jgi:hypothetical protein
MISKVNRSYCTAAVFGERIPMSKLLATQKERSQLISEACSRLFSRWLQN